jgi:carbamoyl-phosphate synthase large subunit
VNKINIGITGTGSLIGQSIIKSILKSNLLKNKVEIIGFDYFNETVGSFWCKKNYILPDILDDNVTELDYVEFVTLRIKENNLSLLFIGVDFELAIFSKYKEKIFNQTGCIVLVSNEDVIEIADDKYKTYEFLINNNLNAPDSWLASNMPNNFEFPLIVKPRRGARSIGVKKVSNQVELEIAISQTNNPIIQEYVGNEGTEYTCGLIFLNNQLKHSIALSRVLKAGNTYISKYSKDTNESIYVYISSIAHKLKPFGSCNLQLRVDNNGLPKLFEINARHSGTTYIRSLFGYNEVEYIINYILFDKAIDFILKEGKVVRFYDEFFMPNTER